MTRSISFAASLILVSLVASANAQSRLSLATVAVMNRDYTTTGYGLDTAFSGSGDFVSASKSASFTGLDGNYDQQTMTLVGSATAQSNYGRLKTKASGTVTNSYYNSSNAPYYDGTNLDEENGSPDSILVAGNAGFTDVMSFGQGFNAGYKAKYVFFIEGHATGEGVSATLQVKIGLNNPVEFIDYDFADGRMNIAEYWSTDSYSIDAQMGQTANVSFASRFDPRLYNYADGSTILGTVDFASTITLSAVLLYDPNGNLVSNYRVTGASGTVYPTQAVPEPATMAALGLGALAVLRRRKK